MKQIAVFTMSPLVLVGLTFSYIKIKNESDSNSLSNTSSNNQVQKQIEKHEMITRKRSGMEYDR